MSKKVIAILSVLKPVNDTRNLEKIAASLGNTNKYEINIIGFSAKNLPDVQNITFYPIFNFQRLSSRRLFAPFKALKKLIQLKPELIIVTCPELLIVTCAYKIIFGCKIIYDIQENYCRNIIYTTTYPKAFRPIIGLIVRVTELLTKPFVAHYILAEKVYQSQLIFTKSKQEILENKAVIPLGLQKKKRTGKPKSTFLYSGTIARHYGIFDAISFIKKLYTLNKDIEFRIVGFAPDQNVLKLLRVHIAGCAFINIVGGNSLITHNQVLKEMANADFCLLPYQRNKSTEGRIPTKLYECLALEIPVIISPNEIWDPIIAKNNAGIIYDFQSGKIPLEKILSNSYYGNNLRESYLWKQEEFKLINIVERVI